MGTLSQPKQLPVPPLHWQDPGSVLSNLRAPYRWATEAIKAGKFPPSTACALIGASKARLGYRLVKAHIEHVRSLVTDALAFTTLPALTNEVSVEDCWSPTQFEVQ